MNTTGNKVNSLIWKLSPNKRHYFCWRNKLSNKSTDYSVFTEEEFKKKYSIKNMTWFKQWEGSEEYQGIMQMFMQQKAQEDLIEVYNVVKEKALTGDDKAVKTFLILQKEFKKRPAKIAEPEQEKENEENIDDGLTLE